MKPQHKIIAGGLLGNIVEAYDISICYYLAKAISKTLFGTHGNSPTMLLGLVFIAYMAKPFGSVMLGIFSDMFGRKNVLAASVLIVGLTTACIGIIPSYEHIGILALVFFLSLRIIQSMAMGSEFLNSASFLVESGEKSKKGFRGCWPSLGVKFGYLLALVTIELLLRISGKNIDEIWRIPFLIALLLTATSTFIRLKMPESLEYILYYAENKKPSLKQTLKSSASYIKMNRMLTRYAFFTSFLSVATGFFYYLYIPIHVSQYANFSRDQITTSTMISLLSVCFFIPYFGFLSDKMDRLKMLRYATFMLLIITFPFMLLVNSGNYSFYVLAGIIISIPTACYYSVNSVILTELFPMQIRCTTLSAIFALAASLGSGLPPFAANILTKFTKNLNSPALIIIITAAIVFRYIETIKKEYQDLQKSNDKTLFNIASSQKLGSNCS